MFGTLGTSEAAKVRAKTPFLYGDAIDDWSEQFALVENEFDGVSAETSDHGT